MVILVSDARILRYIGIHSTVYTLEGGYIIFYKTHRPINEWTDRRQI